MGITILRTNPKTRIEWTVRIGRWRVVFGIWRVKHDWNRRKGKGPEEKPASPDNLELPLVDEAEEVTEPVTE